MPQSGDRKLDVAVWRRFADNREGGLVGFAQCKTGTHWRDYLTELRPESFCRMFMASPLILDPLRIFMVPCRISRDRWEEDSSRGGLLFDRCRIVQFGDTLSGPVATQCQTWLEAALSAN